MIKAIGYAFLLFAFAITSFITMGISMLIVRAIFGRPRDWYRKDELGENDPGVDVDGLEPINADGTPSPAIAEQINTPDIESMELVCPACGVLHFDTGEWYARPHRTHLCLECGHTWRPFEHFTRGV